MIKIPDNILTELCLKIGTHINDLKFLGGGREDSDGTVFTFPDRNEISVLKIIAIPKSKVDGFKKLEKRIEFANFIGENGIKLGYPKSDKNGCLFQTANTDKYLFTAYKMDLIDGHHPSPNEWTVDFYYSWGRLIGKMHHITKQYSTWMNLSGNKEDIPGWQEEVGMFCEWCKDDDVKYKWHEMEKSLKTLPLNRDTYGFIHNDNHINNILLNSGTITIIDFDVANCHFFINDIAVSLQALLFDSAGGMISPVVDYDIIKKALNSFMNGYEQENHLDEIWLQHIDMFINYRRLLLFTVMQDWLNTNHELKNKFKDMINNEPDICSL